jgi:predicted HicB family RNase H-like nuclease
VKSLTHLPEVGKQSKQSLKKTFPIELSEELHKRIKIAAIEEGITLHNWIVRALQSKVKTNGISKTNSGKTTPKHERSSG